MSLNITSAKSSAMASRPARRMYSRVRALNAFVADVYGPRRAVAEGVVPARLIESSEGYEPAMQGVCPPGGTWVAGS